MIYKMSYKSWRIIYKNSSKACWTRGIRFYDADGLITLGDKSEITNGGNLGEGYNWFSTDSGADKGEGPVALWWNATNDKRDDDPFSTGQGSRVFHKDNKVFFGIHFNQQKTIIKIEIASSQTAQKNYGLGGTEYPSNNSTLGFNDFFIQGSNNADNTQVGKGYGNNLSGTWDDVMRVQVNNESPGVAGRMGSDLKISPNGELGESGPFSGDNLNRKDVRLIIIGDNILYSSLEIMASGYGAKTSDTINKTDDLALINTDFTIEAWFNNNTYNNFARIVDKSTSGYGVNGYSLALSGNPPRLFFYSNGSLQMQSSTTMTLNEWNHIVFSFKNSNNEGKIYINEVLDKTETLTSKITGETNCKIAIGNWPHSSGERYLKGNIAEVRIWKSLLTESQILVYKNKQLDNSHPQKDNLVGYWKCNEGSGYTIANSAHLFNQTLSSSFDLIISHMTNSNSPTSSQVAFSNLSPPNAYPPPAPGNFRYWKIQETDAQRESAETKRSGDTLADRKASYNAVYCTFIGFIVNNVDGTDVYNPVKGAGGVTGVISSSITSNGKPTKEGALKAIFEAHSPSSAAWWASNPSDNNPRYIQYDYGEGNEIRPQRISIGSATTSQWNNYAWRKVSIWASNDALDWTEVVADQEITGWSSSAYGIYQITIPEAGPKFLTNPPEESVQHGNNYTYNFEFSPDVTNVLVGYGDRAVLPDWLSFSWASGTTQGQLQGTAKYDDFLNQRINYNNIYIKISDENGDEEEQRWDIEVTNTPPDARFSIIMDGFSYTGAETLEKTDVLGGSTTLDFSFIGGGIQLKDFLWNFGNGETQTTQTPAGVSYDTAGNYSISLTVTNDSNQSDTTTRTFSYRQVNMPEFLTSAPTTVSDGENYIYNVEFDRIPTNVLVGVEEYDGVQDKMIRGPRPDWLSFSWASGTAQGQLQGIADYDDYLANRQKYYGIFIEITDSNNLSTKETWNIEVKNKPPVVDFVMMIDGTVFSGTPVEYLVDYGVTKSVGFQPLIQGKRITAWQWNFGNLNTSGVENPPTQSFSTPKNYSISLKVTNDSNQSQTTTKILSYRWRPKINSVTSPWQGISGYSPIVIPSNQPTTFTVAVVADAMPLQPLNIELVNTSRKSNISSLTNGTQFTIRPHPDDVNKKVSYNLRAVDANGNKTLEPFRDRIGMWNIFIKSPPGPGGASLSVSPGVLDGMESVSDESGIISTFVGETMYFKLNFNSWTAVKYKLIQDSDFITIKKMVGQNAWQYLSVNQEEDAQRMNTPDQGTHIFAFYTNSITETKVGTLRFELIDGFGQSGVKNVKINIIRLATAIPRTWAAKFSFVGAVSDERVWDAPTTRWNYVDNKDEGWETGIVKAFVKDQFTEERAPETSIERRKYHTVLNMFFSPGVQFTQQQLASAEGRNYNRTKTEPIPSEELVLPFPVTKEKTILYKSQETIEVTGNNAFYSPIMDVDDYITIKPEKGNNFTITVKVAGGVLSDGQEVDAEYEITGNPTITKENRADPQKWQAGDSATLNGQKIYFGGVGGDGGVEITEIDEKDKPNYHRDRIRDRTWQKSFFPPGRNVSVANQYHHHQMSKRAIAALGTANSTTGNTTVKKHRVGNSKPRTENGVSAAARQPRAFQQCSSLRSRSRPHHGRLISIGNGGILTPSARAVGSMDRLARLKAAAMGGTKNWKK